MHERVLHGGVDMKIFWLLRMEHVHVWDVYICNIMERILVVYDANALLIVSFVLLVSSMKN